MNIPIIGNLTPKDDFTHPVEAAENFSESSLFHFAAELGEGDLAGGLIRVANRPNQGYAECTMLLWLPGGRTLFDFQRPKITGNEGWHASNWKIDVLAPGGVRYRTRYEGDVLDLRDGRLMADPKRAFAQARTRLQFDLTHHGKAPLTEFAHHKSLDTEGEKERYGTNSMQQLIRCEGAISLGEEAPITIRGFGWRDHSWGARNWQGFTEHIFLTGNFGAEEGFSLWETLDGAGYYFHRGVDRIDEVEKLSISADYADDGIEPVGLFADIRLKSGKRHRMTGRQAGYIPLRNRRDGMETTLGYSLWRYELDNGKSGYGLGEFLRQSWASDGARFYHERAGAG